MSDFLTADIDELMNVEDGVQETSGDKAYRALLESDRKLVNEFKTGRAKLSWPDPIRKKHLK